MRTPLVSAFAIVLATLVLPPTTRAAVIWSQTWTVTAVIPDNDDVGFTDTRVVSLPEGLTVDDIRVSLSFSGGWNGDLYAYLVHDTGFAVLLNRPGRTLANPDGSATLGMSITLADHAADDLHTVIQTSGGLVTGLYQPSGRIADPFVVLDTGLRPAMLSTFNGLNPNGSWTLFVADQSAGETSTLNSWTLEITAIPEPAAANLLLLGTTLLWRRKRQA